MSALSDALALLPAGSAGAQPRVTVLPGGAGRNRVLRIDTGSGRFVWRHRQPPVNRPGSRALTELTAHHAAAAAGLAPAILGSAYDASWILMAHVEGAPWRDATLDEPLHLQRLGEQLAKLHALSVPPDLPEADAPAMARGYQEQLAARNSEGGAEALVERVEALTTELQQLGERPALVHGDLMTANMLGKAPLLVDWEYAQAADPTWDCACLLAYYPRLERHLPLLLASMGLTGPPARARLVLQRERFALLTGLWDRVYG